VDDAQYCSEALCSFLTQQNCTVILVKDPLQSRKSSGFESVHLLDLNATPIPFLTKSWRFGPQTATRVNRELENCRQLNEFPNLEPNVSSTSIVDTKVIDLGMPQTLVARTIFKLFEYALQALKSKVPYCFLRSKQLLREDVKLLKEITRVHQNKPPLLHSNYWPANSTLGSLEQFANESDDLRLYAAVSMWRQLGIGIQKLDLMVESAADSPKDAILVLSTVDSTVGLEFETVTIVDERYEKFFSNKDSTLKDFQDFYIALTRGRNRVEIPEKNSSIVVKRT